MTISLLAAAISAVILAVVVLSPLLFIAVAGQTSRWQELADVGSAYGGVAAVLSGVALVGIALSLLFQWRQTVSSQILALRQHHFELVKLGIDDPRLLGHHDPADAAERTLRQLNANLWVAQWAMLWDLRQCDEDYLRHVAAELFADKVTRAWWQTHGATWSAKPTRRRLRFQQLLTNECVKASEAAPTNPEPRAEASGRDHDFVNGVTVGAVLGLAVAPIVAVVINRVSSGRKHRTAGR